MSRIEASVSRVRDKLRILRELRMDKSKVLEELEEVQRGKSETPREGKD